MTNVELAQFCIHNCRAKNNEFYEDDFRAWDIRELCVSYFLECKFLSYDFILNANRCPRCKNYVKYGDNCDYCQKGVIN